MASSIATCMALLLVASTEALKNVTNPTTNISFDASKPPAAIRVPANFVGFGFETANFNNYSADFSLNLLESTAKRMSELPIIRIGGTSGYVNFCQTLGYPTRCISRFYISLSLASCP